MKILLDCDPGHDDAIAILLAGAFKEKIELVGITTVCGNQTVDKTSKNAYNVCNYLNINVPIAIGSDTSSTGIKFNCGEIHGESGLDGFDFPKCTYNYVNENGVDFIINQCLKHNGLTIVITGPMTNVALAITKNPSTKENIKEIVLMGGSTTTGNMTKYAEYNILADANAANIVFNSDIPIRMIGLNITRQLLVLPNIVNRMEKINNKASKMFVALMNFFNSTQQKVFGLEAGPLHDPVTIVSLLTDDVIFFENMDVTVCMDNNNPMFGATICKKNEKSKIKVATHVDINKYWDIIEKGIRRYE